MIYSKDDPKWVQASKVVAATPEAKTVNVVANFGGHEYHWRDLSIEHHNRWGDPLKGDVVVETEYGWLCVWFNLDDIDPPYKESVA